MSDFSKGPWRFTVSKNGVRQVSSDTHSQICKLWNYRQTVANAHLIAAAPEMYEFIESLQLSAADDARREELMAKARGENE